MAVWTDWQGTVGGSGRFLTQLCSDVCGVNGVPTESNQPHSWVCRCDCTAVVTLRLQLPAAWVQRVKLLCTAIRHPERVRHPSHAFIAPTRTAAQTQTLPKPTRPPACHAPPQSASWCRECLLEGCLARGVGSVPHSSTRTCHIPPASWLPCARTMLLTCVPPPLCRRCRHVPGGLVSAVGGQQWGDRAWQPACAVQVRPPAGCQVHRVCDVHRDAARPPVVRGAG